MAERLVGHDDYLVDEFLSYIFNLADVERYGEIATEEMLGGPPPKMVSLSNSLNQIAFDYVVYFYRKRN